MSSTVQQPSESEATTHTAEIEVSVVVPVHNERGNLPQLLEEIDATFATERMAMYWPYELIFVEDESDDGTAEWVDDAALANENVRSIHLRRSFGQSAALAAGFDAAEGRIVVPMDGDLQNDPADIPRLLEKLEEGYDCVSGWRRDRNDPWHKTIPSAVQTRLAKLTGPDINDFGCTLKAYRREALDDISLYGEGHRYIPAKLYDKGYSVTEIEVNHRPRTNGESRYGAGRLVRGFVDLLFHWFWVQYSSRPLHLFGTAGFLTMGLGSSIGVFSLVQRYAFGVPLDPRTPRLMLVVLLITFGVQLLVFGTLAEMLTKQHYRDEPEYRIERRLN